MICDLESVRIADHLNNIQTWTKTIWGASYQSRVEPYRQYLVDAHRDKEAALLETLIGLLKAYQGDMPPTDQMGFISAYVDEVAA